MLTLRSKLTSSKLCNWRMLMSKSSEYVVRISDILADSVILDLRSFSDPNADNAINFALSIFQSCPLCNVYVWSVSDDDNIVSLMR